MTALSIMSKSGGDGEAPPEPALALLPGPATIRPEGRQAMQDYQSGFRQGSAVAVDSGLRELVIIHPGQAPAPATDPDQRTAEQPGTSDMPTANRPCPPRGWSQPTDDRRTQAGEKAMRLVTPMTRGSRTCPARCRGWIRRAAMV